jgi:hypothetical protein
MEQHLENFLNLVTGSPTAEWTIKFFDKENIDKQNSILINPIERFIIDMRISDVDIFNKIVEKYKNSDSLLEGEESNKNIKLKDNIDLHDFFENMISEEKYYVVGFISHIKWQDDKKIIHSPGSQITSYSIN